ncbi:MAG: SPFH domain-containing protein [Phycisphaerae bacterium]
MAHTHDDTPPAQNPPAPGSRRPEITDAAANRSLSDALRLSFSVLRVAMVVLLLFFIISGVYSVDQNEVVVQTRFGKIVGDSENQVRRPGQLYFGLPEPLDRRIRVPTTEQTLSLDRDFWYARPPGAPVQGSPAKPSLDPAQDGSLLTGDQNIVHAQWTLTYRVDPNRAVDFVRNVGIVEDPDQNPLAKAEALVGMLSRQAIVEAVASIEADRFIGGTSQSDTIKSRIDSRLAELETGLEIVRFNVRSPELPGIVRPAYLAVTQAESERQQLIEEALRQREQLYSEAAGRAYPAALLALSLYEEATVAGDQERLTLIETAIDAMFNGTPTAEALAPVAEAVEDESVKQRIAAVADVSVIGGESRRVINEAQAFRTSIVQQTRADVERYLQLLPSYRQNPDLIKSRLMTEAMTAIFTDPTVETINLPASERMTVIDVGRDPAVLRAIEEANNRRLREQGAPRQ